MRLRQAQVRHPALVPAQQRLVQIHGPATTRGRMEGGGERGEPSRLDPPPHQVLICATRIVLDMHYIVRRDGLTTTIRGPFAVLDQAVRASRPGDAVH